MPPTTLQTVPEMSREAELKANDSPVSVRGSSVLTRLSYSIKRKVQRMTSPTVEASPPQSPRSITTFDRRTRGSGLAVGHADPRSTVEQCQRSAGSGANDAAGTGERHSRLWGPHARLVLGTHTAARRLIVAAHGQCNFRLGQLQVQLKTQLIEL